MFDEYKRTPVNKTAALVSIQSGCTEFLTLHQQKQNLHARLDQLLSDEKRDGAEINKIQRELSRINIVINERSLKADHTRKCREMIAIIRLIESEFGRDKATELLNSAIKIAEKELKLTPNQ